MRLLPPYTQLLLSTALTVLGTSPVAVNWSTKSYGPDGPWQAITVQVGTDSSGNALSNVDLHPGGLYGSMINTKKSCDDITTSSRPCPAEPAGLYAPDYSVSAYQNGSLSPATIQQWQWRSGDAENENISGRAVLDTIQMNTSGGLLTARNTTIAAIDVDSLTIPRGAYTVEVGHLALGGPGNGAFPYQAGVIGQSFPGSLAANNVTPSDSFGLHYGSASLNFVGSLTWGGYDQSRVLGDVESFSLANGAQNNMILSLFDVQIGVENGSSPFNASSFTGLLQLNGSNEQPTNIIPNVPYMYMAPETCAAIAQHLPVVLSAYTNLYIWNTTDPQFDKIINSPSYLSFVFGTSGVGKLTIKVPFKLLNLTLDESIASTPQQYFPCQPFHASDRSNHYILGKAFLQAAFLGMNWQLSKFFLAQAPGPGAAAANLQPIQPTDGTIASNPISKFASSWQQNWTPIAASSNNNASGAAATALAPAPSRLVLSSGAKAGIAVGVVVAVLALAIVLFVCLRRRKGGNVSSEQGLRHQEGDREKYTLENSTPQKKDRQGPSYELGGEGLHEADAEAGRPLPELDAR